MIILLGVMFFLGIALVIYALASPAHSQIEERPNLREIKEIKEEQTYPQEQKILRPKEEIDSHALELEKIKTDYVNLDKELEAARKEESKLKEELTRSQEWVNKSEAELKKTKERCQEFEQASLKKEKESGEEFTKNINLNRELNEIKEKNQLLVKENKEKADQIEVLQHKIEGYIKEVKKHADAISELKKKDEISEWVPKPEFNKLNEEYTELEKELEERDGKIKKLSEEIIRLNNQLKEEKPKTDEG